MRVLVEQGAELIVYNRPFFRRVEHKRHGQPGHHQWFIDQIEHQRESSLHVRSARPVEPISLHPHVSIMVGRHRVEMAGQYDVATCETIPSSTTRQSL